MGLAISLDKCFFLFLILLGCPPLEGLLSQLLNLFYYPLFRLAGALEIPVSILHYQQQTLYFYFEFWMCTQARFQTVGGTIGRGLYWHRHNVLPQSNDDGLIVTFLRFNID
jgi:hypothetical protein